MTVITRHYVHIDETDRSLSVKEDLAPTPGADEILIKVAAAGLNRADVLQRQGLYPPPSDASPIMGLEVSGIVLSCGEAVSHFKPGDEVCALTHGGGYASHAIATQSQTLPVPSGYSLKEAAALPEALLTVWHNLFQRAGLQAGENVLIHGGASGIGTVGIGICKAMGANVYSTAGTAEKCRRIEALGARKAFNYKTEDFVAELDALGLKGAISVILDMVGGDYISRNFEVAAVEGRIVNIAFLRGFNAEVNFLPMLMKRLTHTGSTLRAQSEAQKAQMVREIREALYPHLDEGSINVIIDKEFALAEAQAAQDYMESGVHMGKILLLP